MNYEWFGPNPSSILFDETQWRWRGIISIRRLWRLLMVVVMATLTEFIPCTYTVWVSLSGLEAGYDVFLSCPHTGQFLCFLIKRHQSGWIIYLNPSGLNRAYDIMIWIWALEKSRYISDSYIKGNIRNDIQIYRLENASLRTCILHIHSQVLSGKKKERERDFAQGREGKATNIYTLK